MGYRKKKDSHFMETEIDGMIMGEYLALKACYGYLRTIMKENRDINTLLNVSECGLHG